MINGVGHLRSGSSSSDFRWNGLLRKLWTQQRGEVTIDESGCQFILVVDQNGRLLGTLSDNDTILFRD